MQRIDLLATLPLTLFSHPVGQGKRHGERRVQDLVLADLAADIADDAAQVGAKGTQGFVGALERLGVGVALVFDQGQFADPFIGLAQVDAQALCHPHQPLARPVHQPGIGGEHHILGLDGRIDDHLAKIRGLCRPCSQSRRQALLDQSNERVFPHPLAPPRQRRPIERQLMAEKLLATEVLIIRVLQPPRAQNLVRQIVHRLQDRQSSHQARRQWRAAFLVRVDHVKLGLQELPVDLLRQFHQRVTWIDDLVQPRLEHILLPAWTALFWTHDSLSHGRNIDHGIMQKTPRQLQENRAETHRFRQS